ncbi:MAG: OmpA family protein [Deltaproteobacteria bacterium]|nr:OmpA family protein [Deltaproteobacteria bacterium]MBW2520632.1 OmpA family protein [Deltaproteobacteria bacterium]
MKLCSILTTFSVLLGLCLTGTLHAGQRPEAFSLSPMAGYHMFDGDQNTEDSGVYGFAAGFNVNKRWAIELDARFTPTETDLSNANNEDVDIWTFGLNALYHFNPDGNLVPYLIAGFGGMTFEVDEFKDDEDFMMNWGLGAKYFFTDNWALRLDARHVIDLHSDRSWDHNGNATTDHNFMAMAGLYWQFGGVSPPQPKPIDSDGDGIPDSRDKCPDTALGIAVDAVGCPPVPKPPSPPPPVDGDDDGDGIPNSRDKCPDTPKGVIVDELGCPVKYTLQIEFDFDKAEVRPQYHQELKEAANFINKYPDVKFLLAGHTDSIGSDTYNMELSKHRAAAVKKYLVEQFGIAAHLLYPRGYGERQPIASNILEEGRQRNRRVEVICCMIIPSE